MSILLNFSERLSELILEKQISPERLSRAIDHNLYDIYHWQQGKYLPYLNNVVKLADFFKCSLDFLLGLEDEYAEKTFKECPPFSMQFSRLLQERGTNIYRLNKTTGIGYSTIYDWKNGKTQPQIHTVVRLAKYFECSVDYLVGRES